MGMELIERIRAVLDEDEQVAREAARQDGESWQTSDMGDWLTSGEHGHVMIGEEYGPGRRAIDHIARHDPARVLRQIAAHRKLLDFYQEADQWYNANRTAPAGEITGLVRAIEFLAEALGITP